MAAAKRTKKPKSTTKKKSTTNKKTKKAPKLKRNLALEAAIHEDFDDDKAWLVYGDWLQSEGDPRGELITIQTTLESQKKKSPKLLAREEEILEQHGAALLGPLAEHPETLDEEEEDAFTWGRGFIRSLRLSYNSYTQQEETRVDFPKWVGQVLAHPSVAFVREITLAQFNDAKWDKKRGSSQVYQHLVDQIVKAKPTSLRRLVVGEYDFPDQTEISWTYIGSLDKLWKACPNLQALQVRGGSIDFGNIDAPNLTALLVVTGGLSGAAVKQLAKAKFPKLEHLVIYFGDENYGASGKIADIQPILDGKNLPKVKHLGLVNCEFADDIAMQIGKSKILKQLDSLDLSMGVLSDEGTQAMLATPKAFAHLRELNLSDNFLESTKGLSSLAKKVLFKGQRQPFDEDRRYVAIGE